LDFTLPGIHLKFSLQTMMVLAAVFAVICLGVAMTGFTSLGGIADPTQLADAKGFAWFWAFLGIVAASFGLLAWWMVRTQKHDEDD
jgi:hypothetical protein